MIEEKDLIRRGGQGDSDAFRQLVETYQAPVYRLALRMCGGDAALAEDAAQDVLFIVHRRSLLTPAATRYSSSSVVRRTICSL